MQTITTIGPDIAKSVFQVHGVDANGNVVLHRQLKRRYVLAFFQKARRQGASRGPGPLRSTSAPSTATRWPGPGSSCWGSRWCVPRLGTHAEDREPARIAAGGKRKRVRLLRRSCRAGHEARRLFVTRTGPLALFQSLTSHVILPRMPFPQVQRQLRPRCKAYDMPPCTSKSESAISAAKPRGQKAQWPRKDSVQ
jgi:hypothetical protein